MLSHALRWPKKKYNGPTKSPKKGGDDAAATPDSSSSNNRYQQDEEEDAFGHRTDLPLAFCGGVHYRALGLREVLQSSVQVLGESGLGISEKVVLWDGAVFATKRFWRVTVSKGEFGRRVERLAHVSARCQFLMPLWAYVYAKRTKVVLCGYYAMGSLADLLTGARELGHTPLDWQKRLKILHHVARAIAFIHSQPSAQDKRLQLNLHGNIKTSNVFVKIDLSACLSDYGFVQLAERPEPMKTMATEATGFAGKPTWPRDLSQKCDIFAFGIMMLDVLGGSTAPCQIKCILDRKEDIKRGKICFFEFHVKGRDRKQALKVLEIALDCTNHSPEERPTIDQILGHFREFFND